jgi:hypothetical protein
VVLDRYRIVDDEDELAGQTRGESRRILARAGFSEAILAQHSTTGTPA